MEKPTSDALLTNLSHTPGHIGCPACEAFRQRIVAPSMFGDLPLREAAPLWLEGHKIDIAPKTLTNYEFCIKVLTEAFGDLPLRSLHIGHFQSYQALRGASAGASCINHELNTLKQILDRAGLWTEIAKFYKPLRAGRPTVGRAMDPADEMRLMSIASSHKRWRVAYWCSIITATTTAGPKEITHLHVNDVDLANRPGAALGTLRIRDGIKNKYRERMIPLNASSRWALEQIMERYYRICARLKADSHGDDFILPGRGRTTKYDPLKPMGSWKRAWWALREQAGLPKLRMYDLRHHAITKLMEDPDISDQTVEEMAGHISANMKKRYSHIRLKAKSDATAKLTLRLPAPNSGPDDHAPEQPKERPAGQLLMMRTRFGK
jgi:integrase